MQFQEQEQEQDIRMRPHRVVGAVPDSTDILLEGHPLGWLVTLDCTHTIWCVFRPVFEVHCGVCMRLYAEEAFRAARGEDPGTGTGTGTTTGPAL